MNLLLLTHNFVAILAQARCLIQLGLPCNRCPAPHQGLQTLHSGGNVVPRMAERRILWLWRLQEGLVAQWPELGLAPQWWLQWARSRDRGCKSQEVHVVHLRQLGSQSLKAHPLYMRQSLEPRRRSRQRKLYCGTVYGQYCGCSGHTAVSRSRRSSQGVFYASAAAQGSGKGHRVEE